MKKKSQQINSILLFSTLLIVGCSTSEKEYDFNKIVQTENIFYEKFTNNVVNGKIYILMDSVKVFLGKMKNGKHHGLWTEWYENGQKKIEVNYNSDVVIGKMTSWYENGQLEVEGFFDNNGKENGKNTMWWEN